MEKFLDKLEKYNIFNYLLPGIVFTYLLKYYVGIDIFQSNIVGMFFIYYFIGSIISRVGSVIIEEFLKKVKFVKFADYRDYVSASKEDVFIKKLLIDSNMYRTICAGFFLILIVKSIKFLINYLKWNQNSIFTIILILGFILYLFSYKKQTKFIYERVNIIKEKRNKTEN